MGFPIFQSLERGKDIPQPIEIDIGKCLRFCRSVYCLTQKDVADQIGVPLQTLRQYEQGKGHIPCYMLWTLSNFLRVPIARFFEFEQAAQHDHNNFFWCEDEVTGARRYGSLAGRQSFPVSRRASGLMAD